MNLKSIRRLLWTALISYLLIILSSEKWDVPMFLALPLSCFGIYDWSSFLGPAGGFAGIASLIYLLARKSRVKVYHNIILLLGLLLSWLPFVYFQDKKTLEIEWNHGVYLFLPQVVYLFCSIRLALLVFFQRPRIKVGD